MSNPAVPQPTPAALAALDELQERLTKHEDAAREHRLPIHSGCLVVRAEPLAALLAAARRGAGDTEREKALCWKLTCAQTALTNWGRHFSYCATWDEEPQLCDCGYAKAIRDADPDSFMSKEWCLAAAEDEARAHPNEETHNG